MNPKHPATECPMVNNEKSFKFRLWFTIRWTRYRRGTSGRPSSRSWTWITGRTELANSQILCDRITFKIWIQFNVFLFVKKWFLCVGIVRNKSGKKKIKFFKVVRIYFHHEIHEYINETEQRNIYGYWTKYRFNFKIKNNFFLRSCFFRSFSRPRKS